MNSSITKEKIQKIQSDLDHEKERVSTQLYLTICNLLKQLHEPDQTQLKVQEQVLEMLDAYIEKSNFGSLHDIVDFLSQFRETITFVKPFFDSQYQAQQHPHADVTGGVFMYL